MCENMQVAVSTVHGSKVTISKNPSHFEGFFAGKCRMLGVYNTQDTFFEGYYSVIVQPTCQRQENRD